VLTFSRFCYQHLQSSVRRCRSFMLYVSTRHPFNRIDQAIISDTSCSSEQILWLANMAVNSSLAIRAFPWHELTWYWHRTSMYNSRCSRNSEHRCSHMLLLLLLLLLCDALCCTLLLCAHCSTLPRTTCFAYYTPVTQLHSWSSHTRSLRMCMSSLRVHLQRY
jgi:hypothetical protein